MRMFAVAMIVALGFGCAPEADETIETESTAVEETSAEAAEPPAEESGVVTGPCSVITEAEASEALGQSVRYRSTTDDGSSNCIVDGVDDEMVSVDFSVWQDNPYAYSSAAEMDGVEPVEGLGDQAVWHPSMRTITVEKGSRTLSATFSGLDASAKDRAIAFAREIVEEM